MHVPRLGDNACDVTYKAVCERGLRVQGQSRREVKFGSEVGQIGPKRNKSDLKKSLICPIWGQSDTFWAQF